MTASTTEKPATGEAKKEPTNNTPAAVTSSLPQLGALEEDDEFEEFAAEDWKDEQDKVDISQWEDNWDDDQVEDDFCLQLRAELQKSNKASA